MIRIITGDCREELAKLEPESVHCAVTSPPYFGLRDYGTAKWEGGDPECDHSTPRSRGDDIKPGDKQGTSAGSRPNISLMCVCGARRVDNQIGLEETMEAYIETLVSVFREVKRVLRKDGTVWLNLGDSFATDPKGPGGATTSTLKNAASNYGNTGQVAAKWRGSGLKRKDLMMIPARVALVLQADGWWLRSDIIWNKPNPMPESVADRPTSAHEHVFLLAKSERYYFDAEAVREAYSGPMYNGRDNGAIMNGDRADKGKTCGMSNPAGRNIRNVWTIATAPFPEAHFATFPPALVEPCIKAGCPEGGTVLDPFGGAGTTGLVADRLNRNAILIELNPEYAEMARDRVKRDAPLFAEIEACQTSPEPLA